MIPALSTWIYLIMMVSNLNSQTTEGRRGATEKSLKQTQRSIAPVADCTGGSVDMAIQLKNCYLKCEGYSEPKQGVSIGIYELSGRGPSVVECSGVKLKQTFTESWTFSTTASEVVESRWKPTEQECKTAIKAHCDGYDCDLRPPSGLEPEYHYASSTISEKKVISLHSAQSVLILDDGKELISPLNSKAKLPASASVGEDENSFYFWKPIDASSKCPYSKVGIYGCDEFDEGDEMFYTCSGGGVTVTPRVPTKLLHNTLCPGVMLSEEGFLYDVSTGDPSSDKQGRLSIGVSSGTAETADTTYLRHKVQQVAKKLDSDLCFTQCEVLALENRISTRSTQLVRIGHEHYLSFGNHTAIYCKPTHGCRLTSPPVFCGSPPRLGIECNGISRLWDPSKPYTEFSPLCSAPREVENLTFSLGSVEYNVDHDLTIPRSSLDVHGVYQSEFMRYHNSRLVLDKGGIQALKSKWDVSKKPRVGLAATIENTRKIEAPHISLGGWVKQIVSDIGSVFSSIEAVVGVIVIITAVVMTVSLASKIISLKTRDRSRRGGEDRYETVPLERSGGTVVWG